MAEKDSVYYYDNSEENRVYTARASENNGIHQPEPEQEPQISMRRTEVKTGSVLYIVMAAGIALMIFGSVVYSFNRRNTVYNQTAELNSKLTLAEAENVRLHSELESRMSAKNVEEYAENVLGMRKMDASQIEYIKTRTDDVVNIPEHEESIPEKIKKFLSLNI